MRGPYSRLHTGQSFHQRTQNISLYQGRITEPYNYDRYLFELFYCYVMACFEFISTNQCSIRCFWRLLCTREEVVIFDVVMATWCYGLFSVLFPSSHVLPEDVVLLSSVSHTPTCLMEKPELWNGISPPQSYHNIPSKSNSSNFWFTTCHLIHVGSHF